MNIESIQIPGMMPQTPAAQSISGEGFFNLLSTLLGGNNEIEDIEVPDLESQELDIELDAEPELDFDCNSVIYHPMLFVPQKQELKQTEEVAVTKEYELESPRINIDLKENGNTIDILDRENIPKMPVDNGTLKGKDLPMEGEKLSLERTYKTEFPNLDLKTPTKEKTEPIKDIKDDFHPKEFKFLEALETQHLKLVEKPVDSVKAEDNIQRLNDSIIKLMETTRVDNKSVMKVKLFPEELGTLDLTLEVIEGKVVARILVDNESVKQLFTGKLNELNQNLLKQDVIIQDFKVEVKPDPNLNFNFSGGFNQSNSSKNYKESKVLNLEDIPEEVVEKILRNATDKISILA